MIGKKISGRFLAKKYKKASPERHRFFWKPNIRTEEQKAKFSAELKPVIDRFRERIRRMENGESVASLDEEEAKEDAALPVIPDSEIDRWFPFEYPRLFSRLRRTHPDYEEHQRKMQRLLYRSKDKWLK